MTTGEIPFIASEPHDRVAMVMTGPAYNRAEQSGVLGVEADLEAMAPIARHVGAIANNDVSLVPPQLFIARDSGRGRAYVVNWDTRAPLDAASPASERYFWATDLGDNRPRSSERAQLIRMAHSIGAPVITELSVPDWGDEAGFARVYATALLFGQKPLDTSAERPPLLSRVASEFAASLSGKTNKKLRLLSEVDEMARSQTAPLAPPFVIHRGVKEQLS